MQLQCGKKHNVRAETLYDFQVPVGKIRDVTVVVVADETKAPATSPPPASTTSEATLSHGQHAQAKCTLLIMGSNGHIYVQSLGETNTFALGGTFFATDTFELKHPEIKVLCAFKMSEMLVRCTRVILLRCTLNSLFRVLVNILSEYLFILT